MSSKIDWTRMLGFEQVADRRLAVRDSGAQLNAKVGSKIGGKIGDKLGVKTGLKT